ncbi:hypothetical protein EV210_104299 [Anaerospora hongkongensis]|uniref:Uncharacterized protein n=1 Tax=Anaerospora hongkongensis TaxID=244830 RepID=A0A4R1Q997_9FIRM|nr:hypothetical protein [Anaerospora hongkongensis]TCL38315.1 hypothetical protein EV210_104299 [Anaerospora hongkongensis]
MAKETKTYSFWNGKNIEGKSYVGSPDLLEEARSAEQTEMKYEVGSETVSADDLQHGITYE